jgi:trimeric autotransporter adhesin
MKKIFTLVLSIAFTVAGLSQAPEKMSYQAVVRNANGELIKSSTVGMKISILQGSISGTAVYVETQNVSANANGLVTIEIGGGTLVTGTFSGIDWSAGSYFIKTETDPTGGTNYNITGTSQLLSVPYAMYSKTAGTIGDAVTISGDQTITGFKTFSKDLLVNDLTIGKGKNKISDNTALGRHALYLNTTGNFNTATGSSVLPNNTTGSGNTSAGYASMNFNTTGSNNTATGYAALYTNTTGQENTATGRDALGENMTGQQNTATGYQAILNNTTGYSNSAEGYQALYSNTTGHSNIAIGAKALYKNVIGFNLVAIGDSALYNNIGSWIVVSHELKIHGMYNTAVGSKSLFSNTIASYNTALGYQSLYTNTYGPYNTATGYQSLFSNIEGASNTANGYQALYSNTYGDNNTAIGISALYSNTTGGSNTACGVGALRFNTTGSANVANGGGALQLNTTGSDNVALGQGALSSNKAGFENVSVGTGTLVSNTDGGGNIAIGFQALQTNTDGNDNIAIGYAADVTSGNLHNAIVIGLQAQVNASNKVRIGNNNITVIEGQVGFTSASDMRLKKNIKDIPVGLDFISKLRPVEYQMKKGDDKLNYGFIAQDIEKLVGTNNSILTIGGDADRTLGLRYTDFIAPMVKAIQEQQVIISNQQKEIDELKEQVKALMKK